MASAASSIDAEYTIADDNLQTPDGKEETEDISIYRARATWHMAPELRQIQERDEAGGEKPKILGVAWQNLAVVTGVGCDAICGTHMSQMGSPDREEACLYCFLALRLVSRVNHTCS